MLRPIRVFLDENKDELGGELCPMVFSNFNGDQRGPGLATFIATGTGESIVVDDATLPRRENGKPRLEVLSKYVVFGFGMWLKFPDCFLGCGHGSKTLGYQTRLI